jgi:transcriptional regulator with XRE-family HTH domain
MTARESQDSAARTGSTGTGSTSRGSDASWASLGAFLRSQRESARLSLRQMARLTEVSDSYLSQIERGLFRPSAEVIKKVADALGVSAGALYARVGLLDRDEAGTTEAAPAVDVEGAIRRSPDLSASQKEALLGVYHAFLAENDPPARPRARSRARSATSSPPSPPASAAETAT